VDIVVPKGSEAAARAFAGAAGGAVFALDPERQVYRVTVDERGALFHFDFSDYQAPDFQADLARRDFTINAMALDLREFLAGSAPTACIDLFGGREDLRLGVVRAVSPAVLDDDPLRMLRAVRFAATLGFSIAPSTADAIRARSCRIAEPAPERVRDELFRILAAPKASEHLMLLDGLGLLAPLLPELGPLRGFAPGRYHVHDVLTHSFKAAGYADEVLEELLLRMPEYRDRLIAHLSGAIEQSVTRMAALRFACLLHDVAKPESFTETDGRIRFHGHDVLGAETARRLCRRLRLSRETERLVTGLIKGHMRLFNLAGPGGPSKNALYRYCRDLGDGVPESLLLAQADARATSEIMPKESFTDTIGPMTAVLAYYYEKFLRVEARPMITGKDLIALGFAPGPGFRSILDAAREKEAAGEFAGRNDALDYVRGMR
jgi:putative nucleotidyltransferase with HDIG domain